MPDNFPFQQKARSFYNKNVKILFYLNRGGMPATHFTKEPHASSLETKLLKHFAII